MSRSICNRFTSRRSRASSSRSSVVSAPARPRPPSTSACRPHARSAVSVRSSSRAIVPTLFSLPCTNRTVSALNSGENDRLVLRFRFPMTPSYRTFVRVGVSTKPGEAQSDLNGHDPFIHEGRPTGVLRALRNAFRTQRTPPRLEELVRVHRELSKAAQRLKAAQRGASLFDRSMFEELVALAMGVAAKVVG